MAIDAAFPTHYSLLQFPRHLSGGVVLFPAESVSEALDGLRNHARAGPDRLRAGAAPPRFRTSAPRPAEGLARPATSPAIAQRPVSTGGTQKNHTYD